MPTLGYLSMQHIEDVTFDPWGVWLLILELAIGIGAIIWCIRKS